VEVDSAVVSMTASVEAHGSPPGLDGCVSKAYPLPGRSGGGLNQYHAFAADGACFEGFLLEFPGPFTHPERQQSRRRLSIAQRAHVQHKRLD
jgi:hypothetical protein